MLEMIIVHTCAVILGVLANKLIGSSVIGMLNILFSAEMILYATFELFARINFDDKNGDGFFYTGFDYVFQGEKYANFTRFKEEPKKYKSLKVAENVKKRLELRYYGFNNLRVVHISEDGTCSIIEMEKY